MGGRGGRDGGVEGEVGEAGMLEVTLQKFTLQCLSRFFAFRISKNVYGDNSSTICFSFMCISEKGPCHQRSPQQS